MIKINDKLNDKRQKNPPKNHDGLLLSDYLNKNEREQVFLMQLVSLPWMQSVFTPESLGCSLNIQGMFHYYEDSLKLVPV